jgi:hypothetical protein
MESEDRSRATRRTLLKCRTFVYQTAANTWTAMKLKCYGKEAGFGFILVVIIKSLLGCDAV